MESGSTLKNYVRGCDCFWGKVLNYDGNEDMMDYDSIEKSDVENV